MWEAPQADGPAAMQREVSRRRDREGNGSQKVRYNVHSLYLHLHRSEAQWRVFLKAIHFR